MTVWAYRVIKIKRADSPSFNFRDNQKLVQFLDVDGGFFSSINASGSGMIEIPIKQLAKAIKVSEKLDLDEETVKRIQEDIDFAKSRKEKSVLYDWF